MSFASHEEKNMSVVQSYVDIIPIFRFLSSVFKNVMVCSSKFGAVALKWVYYLLPRECLRMYVRRVSFTTLTGMGNVTDI